MQFKNALNRSISVGSNSQVRKTYAGECAILREWGNSNAPVLFDFGAGPSLWWLLKSVPDGSAYVAPFSRKNFINIHLGGATQQASDFERFVNDIGKLVLDYESHHGRGR